jgi:hypothetical protein
MREGETAECAACGEEVRADASACEHCGNEPRSSAMWASAALVVAGVALLTVSALLGLAVAFTGFTVRAGLYWTDYPAAEYDF